MDEEYGDEETNPPPFDADGNLRVQLAIKHEIRMDLVRS